MIEEVMSTLTEENESEVSVMYGEVKYTFTPLKLFQGQDILEKVISSVSIVLGTYADSKDLSNGGALLGETSPYQDTAIAFKQVLSELNTKDISEKLLHNLKVDGVLVEDIDAKFARDYYLFYELLYIAFEINFGDTVKKLLGVMGLTNFSPSSVMTNLIPGFMSNKLSETLNPSAPSNLSKSESSES